MTTKKTTETASVTNNYSAQYKDPRWQRKRLEIMHRDDFSCVKCGSKDNQLNVHHLFYDKGCKVWEYDDYALLTMCEECHEDLHSEMDHTNLVLRHYFRNYATNSGITIVDVMKILESCCQLDESSGRYLFNLIESLACKLADEKRTGYRERCMEEINEQG